jgi:hypothetical protein
MARKPRSKFKFVKHLEELAAYYGPDMSALPTADQVLSGISMPDFDKIDFSAKYALATALVYELNVVWERYGKKPNILFNEKANNFLTFLDGLETELAVLFFLQATKNKKMKLDAAKLPKYPELMDKIGPFLDRRK